MKTFNNELVVQIGEAFTIDKLLCNKDGSPYIISSKLENPYFLITVAATRFTQADRYVKNFWLSLKDFPRFASTQAVDLSSIKTSKNGATAKYEDFPEELPKGYIGDTLVEYEEGDAVFFLTKNGKTEYKYFTNGKFVKYACRLVKTFSSEDTLEWTGQNYLYSIQLVAGRVSLSDKPIDVDIRIPILMPTKLSVISNIQGGA